MTAEAGQGNGPLVLCYDGSDCSAHAIREAAKVTGGGPALVAHAWVPPSALMLQGRIVEDAHPLAAAAAEFDAAARDSAEELAREGSEIATSQGFDAEPVTLETAHRVWHPIVELAGERDARAVVVGSHGRARIRTALLGSVSHAILVHSRRPVIVIPEERSKD